MFGVCDVMDVGDEVFGKMSGYNGVFVDGVCDVGWVGFGVV